MPRFPGRIEECYSRDRVAEIVVALGDHSVDDRAAAGKLIATRSPVACSVDLESACRAAKLDTLEDLPRRIGVVRVALVEGIWAQRVDKDCNPAWSPATLDDVITADIDIYFAPAEPDLRF